MSEKKKVCGNCKFFWGCGDWDLCCSLQKRRLCYEDEEACEAWNRRADSEPRRNALS